MKVWRSFFCQIALLQCWFLGQLPLAEEVQQRDVPVHTMIRLRLLIGATGEGLFEQRLLGSIPERLAREAPTTVTMTKRYWRLKSLLERVGGSR